MKGKGREDREAIVTAAIIVALIALVVAIFGGRYEKGGSDSEAKVGEPKEFIKASMEPEDTTVFDYSSDIAYSSGNNFVSIHGYGSVKDGNINVRCEPNVNSQCVGKVKVGTECRVGTYYHLDGWYGFDMAEIELTDADDIDGIVWISAYYCSVTHHDCPENNDALNYEVIDRYNSTTRVVINSRTNVNCRPTAGVDYSYGMIDVGTTFDAAMIYRDVNWLFFGFRVEDIEAKFTSDRGDLAADPDGIVWIAVKNLEAYAK